MKDKKDRNRCDKCGSIIDKREIALYKGLMQSLGLVYNWCKDRNRHEFQMKDIRHLIGQINYTRFGDWVMFGGLVYKHGKAHYGLNMERCERYFANDLSIPSRVLKDPITGVIEPFDYKFAREIPGLIEFLDDQGLYKPRYQPRDQETLF